MNRTPRPHREQGQIALALLLGVVAILFLALVSAQVGSAAEQKTQARTAADSAAVAAAQNLRDNRVWATSRTIPHAWATPIFASVIPAPLRVQAEACAAAQRNWQGNPHRSPFSCGSGLVVGTTGVGARTRVVAPVGEVVDGPVDASASRAEATAHARVVLDRCPVQPGVRGALARWITDAAVRSLGSPSRCFTQGDALTLRSLDLEPWTAPAAVGPPQPILTMARNAMRIEIIE